MTKTDEVFICEGRVKGGSHVYGESRCGFYLTVSTIFHFPAGRAPPDLRHHRNRRTMFVGGLTS